MTQNLSIPSEIIHDNIVFLRGQKIILDRDLAKLYRVETKTFNRAVKRNIERFPEDFMFQLNEEEFQNLRCHFGTSSWGGQRYRPYAFNENGIAMLSSVLNSPRAIQVNIQIMRTFTQLRLLMMTHKDWKEKIEVMERTYDDQFKIVFEAIKRLIEEPVRPKRRIGFHVK